jgi:hypothetical protein
MVVMDMVVMVVMDMVVMDMVVMVVMDMVVMDQEDRVGGNTPHVLVPALPLKHTELTPGVHSLSHNVHKVQALAEYDAMPLDMALTGNKNWLLKLLVLIFSTPAMPDPVIQGHNETEAEGVT